MTVAMIGSLMPVISDSDASKTNLNESTSSLGASSTQQKAKRNPSTENEPMRQKHSFIDFVTSVDKFKLKEKSDYLLENVGKVTRFSMESLANFFLMKFKCLMNDSK